MISSRSKNDFQLFSDKKEIFIMAKKDIGGHDKALQGLLERYFK